jgi:hypothetical protein
MADKQRPEDKRLQPSEGEPDRMDWPVPRSGDPPSPAPVATGVAQPIEAAAEASGTSGPAKPDAPPEPKGNTKD